MSNPRIIVLVEDMIDVQIDRMVDEEDFEHLTEHAQNVMELIQLRHRLLQEMARSTAGEEQQTLAVCP